MRHRLSMLALAMLLTACASVAPVPHETVPFSLPRILKVSQETPGQPPREGVLVVQAEGEARTRWSLFDPLGTPLARQILQTGQWRNDGFLPPNRDARALFAALVFAWTPETWLTARYGPQHIQSGHGTRTLLRHGRPMVSVREDGEHLRVEFADGTLWTLIPLEEP